MLDDTRNESPSLKNGVKLPTLTNNWDRANTYFHTSKKTVKHLNATAYNYFKYDFGLVDSAKEDENNFTEMYKNFTKHQLKKELQQLKNKRNPSVSR